jgi:8-oxo-dGTP diphosphatase
MEPRVGVAVILIQNKKVLLGKRKGSHGAGTWAFPGGHLEFGEEVEDCAARELKEETGLLARSCRRGPWTNDRIDGKHYVTLFIIVDRFSGSLQRLEPEKCEAWEWFDIEQLPSPLFQTVRSLLSITTMASLYKNA